MRRELLPNEKRQYLTVLLSEDRAAADEFLDELFLEGGALFFFSEEEHQAFTAFLNSPESEGLRGVWFLFPGNSSRLIDASPEEPSVYQFLEWWKARPARDNGFNFNH